MKTTYTIVSAVALAFVLAAAPVYAEDKAADEKVAEATEDVSDRVCPEPQPLKCPEPAPCPEAASGLAISPEAVRIAEAHLEFLRKETYYIIDNDIRDKDTITDMVKELDGFIEMYRDVPGSEAAYYLKATLYDKLREPEAKLVSLTKILYEYPDSPLKEKAATGVNQLFLDPLKRDWKMDIEIAKGPRGGGDRADRFAQLIEDLMAFTRKDFWLLQMRQYDEFLRRYPSHKKADLVLSFKANTYLQDRQYRSAAYSLRWLATLYPESPLRSESLFQLGNIYNEKLREYDKAVAAYKQVVTDHPGSPQELSSYEQSADLYFKRLKDSKSAIDALEVIIKKYPSQEASKRAFLFMEEIYEKDNQYADAIKTYNRLADMFKGEPAIKALNEAAKLAERRVKDYDLMIAQLDRIYRDYPESEESAEALYAIAETYERNLKNTDKAVEYYSIVVEKYPGHKRGSSAQKAIEKIQKSR